MDQERGCAGSSTFLIKAFTWSSSMYAAQLFSAANRALPDLNQSIAQGEFGALFDWLRQNIWQHGSRFTTEQLITQATGEPLSSRYFRSHLEARYL